VATKTKVCPAVLVPTYGNMESDFLTRAYINDNKKTEKNKKKQKPKSKT